MADHDYAKARQLRRTMSLPEVLLWEKLRKKPLGVKFRRQHPVGPFVLDFYCPLAKVGIEIEGIGHDMGDRPARDEARDAFLRDRGFDVLRVPAAEVLRSVEDAAEAIMVYCRDRC